ncbi:MAG: hypothetical protein IT435_18470 [Phycisphaerales bacterium]|nr:hypothetical protein [Phycisphaerales bacterium]
MSPEQISGHGAGIDIRADIRALGVIGYELLPAGRTSISDGLHYRCRRSVAAVKRTDTTRKHLRTPHAGCTTTLNYLDSRHSPTSSLRHFP